MSSCPMPSRRPMQEVVHAVVWVTIGACASSAPLYLTDEGQLLDHFQVLGGATRPRRALCLDAGAHHSEAKLSMV